MALSGAEPRPRVQCWVGLRVTIRVARTIDGPPIRNDCEWFSRHTVHRETRHYGGVVLQLVAQCIPNPTESAVSFRTFTIILPGYTPHNTHTHPAAPDVRLPPFSMRRPGQARDSIRADYIVV